MVDGPVILGQIPSEPDRWGSKKFLNQIIPRALSRGGRKMSDFFMLSFKFSSFERPWNIKRER